MSEEIIKALIEKENDVNGSLPRFGGNEAMYLSCLRDFINDNTLNELREAIDHRAWDEAFTAVHALKGLAGNMGFVPLFHATGELVIMIREGRMREIEAAYENTKRCYDELIEVMTKHGLDVMKEEAE